MTSPRWTFRHDTPPLHRRLNLTAGLTFSRLGRVRLLSLVYGDWRLSVRWVARKGEGERAN